MYIIYAYSFVFVRNPLLNRQIYYSNRSHLRTWEYCLILLSLMFVFVPLLLCISQLAIACRRPLHLLPSPWEAESCGLPLSGSSHCTCHHLFKHNLHQVAFVIIITTRPHLTWPRVDRQDFKWVHLGVSQRLASRLRCST